ncbi:MAG: hypothetical protein WAO78_09365 [Roseovarius sp.]
MEFSKYTREQLLAALNNEYEYLCHDNFDPDLDCPSAKMLESLQKQTTEQLRDEVAATIRDSNIGQDEADRISLDDYMIRWLQ